MAKALIIDGHSLIYRMYFASVAINQKNPQLDIKRQTMKLIYGVCFKLVWNQTWDYCIVAFDGPRKALARTKEFEQYKANRKPMPETLKELEPMIKNVFNNFGFIIISKLGIEADDLIGSFSNKAASENIDCEIYTSDHDLLQLLKEHVYINLFTKGLSETQRFNVQSFKDCYGYDPTLLPDFKGLAGDNSDNYPGIKGIGKKTAENLLKQFGSIENIFKHLEEIKTKKTKDLLKQNEAQALLFKEIATIDTSLFNEGDLNAFKTRSIATENLKSEILTFNLTAYYKYFGL